MAAAPGRQTLDIEERLLTEGPRFSFVQALRLLRNHIVRASGGDVDSRALDRRVTVRPELSLSYPESDITTIEKMDEVPSRYRIEATFLGLYGAASPLPTFYTEDLLYERSDDHSIIRDFLDVLNAPLYAVYFGIWSKYRLYHGMVEHPDERLMLRLFSLLGFEGKAVRSRLDDPLGLVRYMGLFSQHPRSAAGLRSLLADRLGEPSLRIEQCVPRLADIPEDQRCRVGVSSCSLGTDAYLGAEMMDRTGKFRIRIERAGSGTLHDLLPDSPAFVDMANLVGIYNDQPLDWDMEFVIDSSEIEPARPGGGKWSRLGWNTWLGGGSGERVSVTVARAQNFPEDE